MTQNKGLNYKLISTIIKYLFSALITIFAITTTGEWKYVALGLFELGIIILTTDLLLKRNPIAGRVLNCLLCLLYNAQLVILFFGNSFLQLVMVTNIASIQSLGGKALEYGFGLILVLIYSFLPVYPLAVLKKKNGFILLPLLVGMEVLGLCMIGSRYSPTVGYAQVISQAIEISQLKHKVNSIDGSASDFYSAVIEDHIRKDPRLPDYPNIILIFTEGLSQSVVDDDREIMPNLVKLQAESINFTNYYNHTFATYRGLSGQLYSGYQLNNLDENNLIAIQDVLGAYQYHTAFINTEPANPEFTGYLQTFDFDEVIGSVNDTRTGMTESYSDKEAYEMLFDTACSLEKADSPYFLGIYTYGTHVTLNSVNEVYGDGSNAILNKFFNLDVQLGDFIRRFKESELFDDTIIIFTTDHATYQDSDFTDTFPQTYRASSMVDEIPLCIYYKGVTPRTYDVNGRNSLSLSPTILDFLDISYPNYFLGASLFASTGKESHLDTIFNEEAILLSTKDGVISVLAGNASDSTGRLIQEYFVAKKQDITDELTNTVNGMFVSGIETLISDDGLSIQITYYPKNDEYYNQIWFPVWSSENDQDDKIVYPASHQENGSWVALIDLTKHTQIGEINIHVYGGETDATDLLSTAIVILE